MKDVFALSAAYTEVDFCQDICNKNINENNLYLHSNVFILKIHQRRSIENPRKLFLYVGVQKIDFRVISD